MVSVEQVDIVRVDDLDAMAAEASVGGRYDILKWSNLQFTWWADKHHQSLRNSRLVMRD